MWLSELRQNLHWWFWGSLWFNRRKDREFFDNIKSLEPDDPSCAEINKAIAEAMEKFKVWNEQTKGGDQ